MVDRLHLAIADIFVVVLLVAALSAAVTHIEHYCLRSNYRTIERSTGNAEERKCDID